MGRERFRRARPEPSQGRQTIMLVNPCPRCAAGGKKGHLEKDVQAPEVKTPPPVRCIDCGTQWPNYLAMFKEAQGLKGPGVSLDRIQEMLGKGKAYVRGARNVAERVRGIQGKLRDTAAAVKNIKQKGAVTEIGANLEDVLTEMMSGIDDVKDAVKGEVAPFIGEEAESAPEHTDEA